MNKDRYWMPFPLTDDIWWHQILRKFTFLKFKYHWKLEHWESNTIIWKYAKHERTQIYIFVPASWPGGENREERNS